MEDNCDIFNIDYIEKPYTLMNAVNCVGVMGKGIALEFKNRYPAMYKDYVKRCNNREVKLGVPYYYTDEKGTSIINFPTKYHWRDQSEFCYITSGLELIVDKYKEWGIERLVMPAIGCGLGGLDWEDVCKEIVRILGKTDMYIILAAPL